MIQCPICHGHGEWMEPILWKGIGGGPRYKCNFCKGTGEVSMKLRMKWVRSHKRIKKANE